MTDPEATNEQRGGSILKSAIVALVAALLALLFFVLPAEYGIDPTGVGERLGLTALADVDAESDAIGDDDGDDDAPSGAGQQQAPPSPMILGEYPGIPDNFDYYEPDVLGEPYSKEQPAPYRSDTFEIRLEEFEQVEYKALLNQGDAIVYSWSVDDGIVYTDFHADPGEGAEGYPDQYFIRYRESEAASDSGSLVAPFDGNHGWYWLNIEDHPITITLTVSGYYSEINELFRSFQ